MRFLPAVLLPLLLTASADAAGLQLASRGETRYRIVQQPGATAAERHAAAELARYLNQATGARFPVLPPGAVLPRQAIVVGPGPVARKLFPAVVLGSLGPEALVIQRRGERLLLAGGRPRGTLYAVYRFLQDHAGCRWWAPWASTVPRRSELTVDVTSVVDRPAFQWRDVHWFSAFDGDWAARNFVNGVGVKATARTGGRFRWHRSLSAHTLDALVPPEPYFRTHPEWFSQVDGQRIPAGQLCLTDPALRRFLVARLEEWLSKEPDARILSVSQNDTGGHCECDRCRRINQREGSPAGSLLDCVNYLAGELGARRPEVLVDTLAYHQTRRPPRFLAARPNVVVRVSAIDANFAQPLDHPSNAAFLHDLREWRGRCRNLFAWDYTTNFAYYPIPYPNWFVLGPNLRALRRCGVDGVFEQGAFQTNGAEMAELRAWLLARLLWNPEQDDRALIDEFLAGYYGPRPAPLIAAYLHELRAANEGFPLTIAPEPEDAPYLAFRVLSRAEVLWARAEQVAAGPEQRWRVRQGHAAIWYACLVRWNVLRRECRTAGAAWPWPETRAELAERWRGVALGSGPPGWSPLTRTRDFAFLTADAVARRFASVDSPGEPAPTGPRGRPPGARVLLSRPRAVYWLVLLAVAALLAAARPAAKSPSASPRRTRSLLGAAALPVLVILACALLPSDRPRSDLLLLAAACVAGAGAVLYWAWQLPRRSRAPAFATMFVAATLLALWLKPYLVARYAGANAALAGADLAAADLRSTNLQGMKLNHARLERADFRDSWLGLADLSGADLRAAVLRGAVLNETLFRRADLRGADLRGAKIEDETRTSFAGARFDAATRWPAGFRPADHGAVRADAPR